MMNEFDSQDPLWALLGKAKTAKASPFFVRKVLRAVREEESRPRDGIWTQILRWLVPASVAASLVLLWGGLLKQEESQARLADFNSEFSDLADLPSLVAYEDTPLWVSDSSN